MTRIAIALGLCLLAGCRSSPLEEPPAPTAPPICRVDSLRDDPSHCGACGHSCLGGGCIDGACQPVELADEGGRDAWGIAVDEADVYWAAGSGDMALGALRSISKDGGATRDVATGLALSMAPVAVDGTHVYSTTFTSIVSVPKHGGDAISLASASPGFFSLTLDDERIYWSTRYEGSVWSLPKQGGSAVELARGQGHPSGLSRAGSSLYWANQLGRLRGHIVQVDAAGGAPRTVTIDPGAQLTAADEDDVFWVRTSEDPIDDAVMSIPRRGGSATELARIDHAPVFLLPALVVDATAVHVVHGHGTSLSSIRRAGGAPHLLTRIDGTVASIASDERALYWTEQRGGTHRIMKIAK